MKKNRTPSACLDTALEIVAGEVSKLKVRSEAEEALSKEESDMLNNYVKTLVLLNKDEREASKALDLKTKSDDELAELAKEAMAFLAQDKEEKQDEPDKPTESPSNDQKDEGV